MSTSEATVWKGSSMWSAQKASEGWRSYVFFVAAPAPPSPFSSIVSRLRRMPSTSWQSAQYDQQCCTIVPRSAARSKSTRSGRWYPDECDSEKRRPPECDLSWSCSRSLSRSATACAGPPRG